MAEDKEKVIQDAIKEAQKAAEKEEKEAAKEAEKEAAEESDKKETKASEKEEKKKDKKVYSSVLRYQCILDCHIFQDIFSLLLCIFLIGIT